MKVLCLCYNQSCKYNVYILVLKIHWYFLATYFHWFFVYRHWMYWLHTYIYGISKPQMSVLCSICIKKNLSNSCMTWTFFFFFSHILQTTTWIDPRKTVNQQPNLNGLQNAPPPPPQHSPNVSLQNIGPLPPGWEQAFTPEGEMYYINHMERNTSWMDPRLSNYILFY